MTMLAVGAMLTLGQSSAAQTSAAAGDSVKPRTAAPDSLARDSTRWPGGSYRGPHALQGVLYSLVIAPAGITAYLDSAPTGTPSRLSFWRNHVSVYGTGGGGATPHSKNFGDWAGSANVEVLRRGTLVEARLEQFRIPGSVQYRTIRIGRLGHPAPAVAAGVTVGYRAVRGPRSHEGFEVGFPLVAGGRTGWVRFESSYVASLKQVSWNYRLQGERVLGRGPFFTGIDVELKSWEIRNRGKLSHGTFGLLFGATWKDR